MTFVYVILAFVLGLALAALASRRRHYAASMRQRAPKHGDYPHLADLLCRAHGATAACFVIPDIEPIWGIKDPGPSSAVLERAAAVIRLAMGDGREHILSEGQTIVACGEGQIGGALVFESWSVDSGVADAVVMDLRRIFADHRAHRAREAADTAERHVLKEQWVAGPESVEGIAFQLCESALDVSGRANALVLKDATTQEASVIAVSTGTDRRILGMGISSDAAVGRACMSEVPIAGADSKEFFGALPADRRRQLKGGVAFPLWDGKECVGALALFGNHSSLESAVLDRIQWLVKNSGPRLGRAAAVRNAENRAMTDELTGLANRRSLERAMHDHDAAACSVLCIDLDHFKALNDGFGHAAGDAALRHVARVFRRVLREGDLPARVGGEEFALWLPGAPAGRALEVAERVCSAVREERLFWSGAEIQITCSIGVASIPESVSHVDNLLGAGDVAMYRAKESGRNRVEMAARSPS